MTLHANLARAAGAGEPLKPWLILGPLYENISAAVPGLTLYEEPHGSGGERLLEEIATAARVFLTGADAAAAREGSQAAFRGQSAAWSLARGPEPFLTWGSYFTQNHLNTTLLSASLTPAQPGPHRWRLSTRIASRVLVAVNAELVFDSGSRPAVVMEGQEDTEFSFEAPLASGQNRVGVALLRAGRMARVGFCLALDGPVFASAPLGEGLSPQARSQVEEQIGGLRLERDILYPEHAVSLHLGQPPQAETPLIVRLLGADGTVLREESPTQAGPLVLAQGADLADGAYQLCCEWRYAGAPLTAVSFHLNKTTPTAPLEGYEHLAERKRRVLEFYAGVRDKQPPRLATGERPVGVKRPEGLWNQVALYALERFEQVDEAALRAACEFIAACNDTSDFVIQGILRLLYWERKQPRLSPTLRALMKETVLNFKYWVDEPGDTVMWMDSENHRLLFHSAEWLAGQLYPLEEFSNSRQRGLFHALKGRTYASEWMRQRGLYGFDEWHSNTYYAASMLPLFNIYDFTPYEDHKLRLLAGGLLDVMFFNLAADSFQGAFGVTHGRTYAQNILHPDFEGTAGLAWLAFGRGALRREGGAMGPVALATGSYCLPPILAEIAADRSVVLEARERQGIASKGMMEFYPLNRDRFADFRVYRTPDYLMCGLQDFRVGEYEPAVHTAQVTLGNHAVIFWSAPYTSHEGGGLRPDYWSGNTCMPRVVQAKNVLALTFRLSHGAWMSHCFFEPARFDEVRFIDKWAFARVEAGYVGIWSQHGYRLGSQGQYAGRELVCDAPDNTWLAEGGREADWISPRHLGGSFEAFCAALSSAEITEADGVVSYASPSAGRFVTGWQAAPTLNGESVQLHGYPLVDSPWAHADFGSGRLTIRYGDQTHEVYFQQ